MFFRTGEFAEMLSIEKSLLFYYDRIGLFRPHHVDENGYRCYSAEQTRDFYFIRLLHDLGLSLEDISSTLSARDPESLEKLFRLRSASLDSEIEHLTTLRNRLRTSAEDLASAKISDPKIVFLPEKRFAAVDLSPEEFRDKKQRQHRVQILMQAAGQSISRDLFKATLVPLSSLLDGSFLRGCFCVELAEGAESPLLRIRPEGNYACITCASTYADLSAHYLKLLRYAEINGFTPCGDGMDRELAGPFGSEEYLLELTIPLQEKAL